MEKQIHDGDFVVGLTVSQFKALLGDLFSNLSPNRTATEPEYLSIQEASEFLKYKISTLYDMVHRRAIPFVKPEHGRRRLYFEKAKLVEWKSACRFETHDEAFENQKKSHQSGKSNLRGNEEKLNCKAVLLKELFECLAKYQVSLRKFSSAIELESMIMTLKNYTEEIRLLNLKKEILEYENK